MPKRPALPTALIHHAYVPPPGFAAPQPGVFKASTVIFADTAALHARDWREPLRATEEVEPDGSVIYALDAPTVACGQFQGAIRVFPAHELLTHPYELGLMKWMDGG